MEPRWKKLPQIRTLYCAEPNDETLGGDVEARTDIRVQTHWVDESTFLWWLTSKHHDGDVVVSGFVVVVFMNDDMCHVTDMLVVVFAVIFSVLAENDPPVSCNVGAEKMNKIPW